MDKSAWYALAADLVLGVHALFVAFVVLGLGLVLLGGPLGWRWVRNPWFRLAHLLSIGVVVAQAWLGVVCPFTVWEMSLRSRAGEAVYPGAFIGHWVEQLLYYQASPLFFAILYTGFALTVVASWYLVRPRKFR